MTKPQAKTYEPDVTSTTGENRAWADTDTIHSDAETRAEWEKDRDAQVDAQRAKRVKDDAEHEKAHREPGQNSDTRKAAPLAPNQKDQPVPYRNQWQPSAD